MGSFESIDKSNRDGEKFICVECGYYSHADIGAAKTIRDRALAILRGDSAKLGASRLNAQKISPRTKSANVVSLGTLATGILRPQCLKNPRVFRPGSVNFGVR